MKFYHFVPQADTQPASQLYRLDTDIFSIEADPVDRNCYRASAETATLGALTLARIHTSGAVIARKQEEFMNAAFKSYSLVYVIEGALLISYPLGTSILEAGEFTLMDNSEPRTMLVKDWVTLFLVSIPHQVLQRYLPTPEVCVGLSMGAICDSDCRQEPVFAPLLAVWEKLKCGSLREFAPCLSAKFLKRVTRIYASHYSGLSSAACRRITEVKQAVEAQLCNPQLSVEYIANAMGVSSRYLRGLFHCSERISNLILRRRLEECASQLHNPVCQHDSIASIAQHFGFISPAHFSRAFRKQFGFTPRDFRKRNLLVQSNM